MSNFINASADGTLVTGEIVATSSEITLAHDNFFDVSLFYDEARENEISETLYTLGDEATVEIDGTEYTGYNKITLDSTVYSSYTNIYATYKTRGDFVDAADINSKIDIVDSAVENNFASFDSSGSVKDSTKSASDFATAAHNHDSDYADIAHVSDTDNPHSVDKTDVGLGNVDNTSDVNKPISSATQSALDAKEDDLGNPDTDGKVLSSTALGVRSWVEMSSGETNTAANVGTAGVGVYKEKDGVELRFKKINAGSSKVTITDDIANDEIDIDVDTSNFGLTTSDISDFDTEVSNNTDVDANTTARHDAVTVTDSSEVDFTLTGQEITAALKDGSVALGKLASSVQTSLEKADSALQSAPVDSVNGETGTVTLDADDIDDSTTAHKFVTSGDLTNLGNLSGTNSGDETKSSIETTLGAATSENNGYLTSTDWNTFNDKADVDFDINGQTELAEAPADTDELGLYDTDVMSLKKVTFSNIKAGIVNDSITDSNTDTAPSENAVYDALALKSDTTHDHDSDYNNYTHPNHTGDVTSSGDGETTIVNKQTLSGSGGITISNSPTVIAAAAPDVSITYGTTADTACEGNDSRLSDARTPTTHDLAGTEHGTSTLSELNAKISDATLIDTDDSRLSDARTPTSHTHGNITNDGKVGTTANIPLITGTAGVIQAGAFGTSANQFAAGDHNHSGTYEPVLNDNQKRTITTGTGDPSGGSDGDIYIKYTA